MKLETMGREGMDRHTDKWVDGWADGWQANTILPSTELLIYNLIAQTTHRHHKLLKTDLEYQKKKKKHQSNVTMPA